MLVRVGGGGGAACFAGIKGHMCKTYFSPMSPFLDLCSNWEYIQGLNHDLLGYNSLHKSAISNKNHCKMQVNWYTSKDIVKEKIN